ncbi:acyl-CoA dehydrogenase family protein [Aliarcobacter cryaerophilus]|uniref:acyl-CoA dehydrogenase family protein n=1 Tax=Aliarcobacter cryaerophilus TaxID=28198 RepID=UPI0008259783|nr:acyl-CoA dehydrogenase family protein [Aliarcobacter cryaerophilus]
MSKNDLDLHNLLSKLEKQASNIDIKGIYPEEIVREFAKFNAYKLLNDDGTFNFDYVINLHSQVASICLNTAFCMWCQSACVWYLLNTENVYLKKTFLKKIIDGNILAGTGLSNAMKALCNFEEVKLKAVKTDGGYIVNGSLPFVSNVQKGHYFGALIQTDDGYIVGLMDTNNEALSIQNIDNFFALNGSATVKTTFKDYFLEEKFLISDNGQKFIEKIRPGFILLQLGMALGNIDSCINIIKKELKRKEYLNNPIFDDKISLFEKKKEELTFGLDKYFINPYTNDVQELKKILQVRLDGALLSHEVSNEALLCSGGSRGYFEKSDAFCKLRESYFVGVVTPSIKHLKILISNLK